MTESGRDRRARRAAVVIEHMQSENVQQWDRTMATFSHPATSFRTARCSTAPTR